MNPRLKLFAVLWAAGVAGALSFWLVDLSALVGLIPGAAEAEVPFSPLMLKVVSVVQPSVLLALAVLGGVLLAPKVGLHAPVAEALVHGRPIGSALRLQILPGLIGGLAGGVIIAGIWLASKPFLPERFVTLGVEFTRTIPLVTRLLYGGVTEELLLRWGMMSLLLWILWRIFQRGQGAPRSRWVIVAIVGASLLFGLGHLPVAFVLNQGLTPMLVAYVVSANSAFGLIAGWLYWKKGLESAMLAHMVVHLVLFVAVLS
jgi:hypothetical protein